jgi:hypothetical protein
VPGAWAVFERFPDYVPGPEPASRLAVGKRIVVERIGWAATQLYRPAERAYGSGMLSSWRFYVLRLLHNVALKTRVWSTYEVPWISFISQSCACCILRIGITPQKSVHYGPSWAWLGSIGHLGLLRLRWLNGSENENASHYETPAFWVPPIRWPLIAINYSR